MKDIDLSHLTKEQKAVIVDRGTERPFTGIHLDNKDSGTFVCAACKAPLFKSDSKYESGSGWPAFEEAIDPKAVALTEDLSHGMRRVSAECAVCDGHLGHYFKDGMTVSKPQFCINSVSLDFVKDND